jgi:polyketide cyclase/dehydrase/lipid transport protein
MSSEDPAPTLLLGHRQHGRGSQATPQFSESIEIAREPADVWRVLATPERWFDGYVETRTRSANYPDPNTRNDHVYHTRANEHVRATVVRSEAPTVLEEHQQGTTFVRELRYSLTPSAMGTSFRVQDEVRFKGLARLAAPIAVRDIEKRWTNSLKALKVSAESG